MVRHRMTLLEQLRKYSSEGNIDFLRQGVKTLAEAIMELEVRDKTGADLHERKSGPLKTTMTTGSAPGIPELGSVPLETPRLRDGSYFPSLLEPRRRAEQALLSVINIHTQRA